MIKYNIRIYNVDMDNTRFLDLVDGTNHTIVFYYEYKGHIQKSVNLWEGL